MALAINPANHRTLLAALNDQTNSISIPAYAFSTDGGSSWNATVLPDVVGSADPSVAFDQLGFAYYAYLNTSNGDVFVARTSDLGVFWQHFGVSPSTQTSDKPYMAVDNTSSPYAGRLYASWKLGLAVRFKLSPDHGATWHPEGEGCSVSPSPCCIAASTAMGCSSAAE